MQREDIRLCLFVCVCVCGVRGVVWCIITHTDTLVYYYTHMPILQLCGELCTSRCTLRTTSIELVGLEELGKENESLIEVTLI